MRSFSRITKVPNSAAVLSFSGEIDKNGTLKYSALLVVDGKMQETIHYNPEMLISQRWGYRPDNSILYREDYTEGKLTRREWLKEVNTPVGPREVPDYTENF